MSVRLWYTASSGCSFSPHIGSSWSQQFAQSTASSCLADILPPGARSRTSRRAGGVPCELSHYALKQTRRAMPGRSNSGARIPTVRSSSLRANQSGGGPQSGKVQPVSVRWCAPGTAAGYLDRFLNRHGRNSTVRPFSRCLVPTRHVGMEESRAGLRRGRVLAYSAVSANAGLPRRRHSTGDPSRFSAQLAAPSTSIPTITARSSSLSSMTPGVATSAPRGPGWGRWLRLSSRPKALGCRRLTGGEPDPRAHRTFAAIDLAMHAVPRSGDQ